MADRVFLHVGAPKTATTYLQDTMFLNRDELAAQGVLVPGRRVEHFRTMLAVTGRTAESPRPRLAKVAWQALVDEASGWSGSVVVSSEMLALASAEQAAAALESFGPAEVHVVYTVRDLARTVPSEWQQELRAGGTLGLDAYVAAIRNGSPDAARFESLHDVEDVVARWGAALPAGQVHLVTVPPPGAERTLVWRRLASVLGVDPGSCREPKAGLNTSLDPVAAEVLRRVNVHLAASDVRGRPLVRWVRKNVVHGPLAERTSGRRIVLRGDDYAWVADRARRLVHRLEGSGYDVVGDLGDLVPAPEPTAGSHPDDADPAELNAMATKALAALVVRWFEADTGRSTPGDDDPDGSHATQ
jgi:hypothetical protein